MDNWIVVTNGRVYRIQDTKTGEFYKELVIHYFGSFKKPVEFDTMELAEAVRRQITWNPVTTNIQILNDTQGKKEDK